MFKRCSQQQGFWPGVTRVRPTNNCQRLTALTLLISAVAGSSGTTSPADATTRPMRNRQTLVLTLGQTEGDFQGKDDKGIQAAIEYLNRLGGGTLRLLPGRYTLRNSIYLRPRITLQGSGDTTILEKADSV